MSELEQKIEIPEEEKKIEEIIERCRQELYLAGVKDAIIIVNDGKYLRHSKFGAIPSIIGTVQITIAKILQDIQLFPSSVEQELDNKTIHVTNKEQPNETK